ncbi:MAG: tyrosine-type recombinase/integrase [Chitinophagales bacterium]|nr:tyrosine-type recombinase/integrase [Chitinophagales bacterium]
MYKTSMSLHNAKGQRKYLNNAERRRFLESTKTIRTDKKLFCQLLFFTGARIGEIHNLRKHNIDFSNETVIIETLKRRRKGVYREIPIPSFLLDDLRVFIERTVEGSNGRLFTFSLRTGSRYVKDVMNMARIEGLPASAKGLRHGFAVHAISKVSITLVTKWLGHAKLETTQVYTTAIGVEEREMAAKLWDMDD